MPPEFSYPHDLQLRERELSLLPLTLLMLTPVIGVAQEGMVVRDNSFLIEEAYNQEAGVVQHVSTFQRVGGDNWAYSFTQEWPLGGIRHQLSWSLGLLDATDGVGLGDGAVNYRYQLVGADGSRTSVAPRISVLLPTGSWERGRGRGSAGVQFNLPVSVDVAPAIVIHGNVGSTLVPSARGVGLVRAFAADLHAGGGIVYLMQPWVNLMLEALWLDEAVVVAEGEIERASTTLINPGVRLAFNAGTTQLVPGIAWTIDTDGDDGLFLYLSVEHGF